MDISNTNFNIGKKEDTQKQWCDTNLVSQNLVDAAEQEQEINPFERRSSIKRTPPSVSNFIRRSKSISDPMDAFKQLQTDDCSTPNSQKRRRDELSPEEKTSKKKSDKKDDTVDTMRRNFNSILEEVKRLELVVKNMYNPKRELKEISGTMSRLAKQLRNVEVNTINKLLNPTLSQRELYEENRRLREELLQAKTENLRARNNPPSTGDVEEVQCPNCKTAKDKKLRRRSLKTEETYQNFLNVTENDWYQNVFPVVEVVNKPIWESPFEEDLVLPCSSKLTTNNKMVGTAINKFGGQNWLLMQNRRKGEVAKMSYTLAFPDSEGNTTQNTRGIYYPIITEGEAWEKVEDETLFKALKELKEEIINNDTRIIAFPEMEGVSGIIYKRMIEYLYADTGVEIKMYSINKDLTTKPQLGKKAQVDKNTAPERKSKKKSDGLIIQVKDKSYAEMLTVVKQKINPAEFGVDIKDISQTRQGDLLLKVGNGFDKAEELKQVIKEKIPDASTSLLLNKKVIHIKGMDGITKEHEIRGAISSAISVGENSFKLSSLRPAFGNRQNVTVIMQEEDAEKLLKMEIIKIGWTSCKVRERKVETRCYRCWEHGHIKAECKGPNREALCINCAKEGHKASNCENDSHCVICKQGHRTGSARCPARK